MVAARTPLLQMLIEAGEERRSRRDRQAVEDLQNP